MGVYQRIISRISIDKGWSGERKYCATTEEGQKYLLRISAIDRLERKHREYEKMSEVAQLGIPMCLPMEFGICEEGAYSIQSWIDGEDAEEKIMAMDFATQDGFAQSKFLDLFARCCRSALTTEKHKENRP